MLKFFGLAAVVLAMWNFWNHEWVAGGAWTLAALAAAVFLALRHFNDGSTDR